MLPKKTAKAQSKRPVKSTNKSITKRESDNELLNSDLTKTFSRVKKSRESIDITEKKPSRSTNTKSKDIKEMESKIEIFKDELKAFDLNCDYGPFLGISRHDRLARAEYFHFQVDEDVKKVLENGEFIEKHPDLDLNIWHDIERLL